MKLHLTIELEQSGIWRKASSGRHRVRPKGEPGLRTRPVRLKSVHGDSLAKVHAFPLQTATIDSLSCAEVLEFVRNDEALINEIARVLVPGGVFRLRVPTTGPFAGFDHLNLMHYLVDTTRRGARPYETYEVGWRRHYSLAHVEALLGEDRFRIVSTSRRRVAVAELIGLVSIILFRWCFPSAERFRAAQRFKRRVERFEDRIRSPFGAVLDVTAIRLDKQ